MSNKVKPEKVHDLLDMIRSLSLAKGIDEERVFKAMEAGLAKVSRKRHDNQFDVRVAVDRDTGYFKTFKQKLVVEDDTFIAEFSASQIPLSDAKTLDASLEAGDLYEEEIESIEFGRKDAHSAKISIMKEVREAELRHLVEKFQDKVNTLVTGTVKKVTREYIILDLGDNVEAQLLRSNTIPNESFRINDRVRAFLFDAHYVPHGPQLFVSRTCPEMLMELFRIEVPEIGEQVIAIKGAARDPGSRAKIAVKTNDGRIDPIGACIGQRGTRIQTIIAELSGEKIDIIEWDADPKKFIINSLSPAKISSVELNEEEMNAVVWVSADQLSLAIGKGGQNVRLASRLTGWRIDIREAEGVIEEETEKTETEEVAPEVASSEEPVESSQE